MGQETLCLAPLLASSPSGEGEHRERSGREWQRGGRQKILPIAFSGTPCSHYDGLKSFAFKPSAGYPSDTSSQEPVRSTPGAKRHTAKKFIPSRSPESHNSTS